MVGGIGDGDGDRGDGEGDGDRGEGDSPGKEECVVRDVKVRPSQGDESCDGLAGGCSIKQHRPTRQH